MVEAGASGAAPAAPAAAAASGSSSAPVAAAMPVFLGIRFRARAAMAA